LTDDVFIEEAFDIDGFLNGQAGLNACGASLGDFFLYDAGGLVNAMVANVTGDACDEDVDFAFLSSAK
jgi:hypothetical protein